MPVSTHFLRKNIKRQNCADFADTTGLLIPAVQKPVSFLELYTIKLTANSRIALCGSRNAVSFSSTHLSARPLRHQRHRELPLQFHKSSQLFIGADDKALSIAVRVHNPDR